MNRVKKFNSLARVVRLIASDKCQKEIAAILGLSVKTVEYHWKEAKKMFGFKSPVGATLYALRLGLVSL